MRRIFKVGLVLALSLATVKGQGYGNIEDDSAPSSNLQTNQQLISSLPQYDAAGYEQESAPAGNNLQGNGQNYWWMNQNAFQKPAGHPGVERGENAAPQQSNRAPYNPPQNAYTPQQPKPQTQRPQQQPYKPQAPRQPSQQSQQRPSSNNNADEGWSAPESAQSAGFNLPPPSNSLGQPGNDFAPAPPKAATFECMLLNKADCHKGPQAVPAREPYDTPYTAPLPQQNYRPPTVQPPRPQPQQYQPQKPVQTPPGFYQPPVAQAPQIYDTQPNQPSNQNYQPQYSSDSQSQSSAFPQSPQKPYKPQPQNNQQQYRPAPQQPQQNQYYQSQPQQPQQPIDDTPYPGCPAAMLCVQEDQCNMIGVIEENLRLSRAEKAFRVALSQCSEPTTGTPGVCCRDPNYKDPWPNMNGGGNDGQYHPDHHSDKGQAKPQQAFRNPYSGTRGLSGYKAGCNNPTY